MPDTRQNNKPSKLPKESVGELWLSDYFWETVSPTLVEQCLAGGRGVVEKNDHGATPLHLASQFSNHPEIIDALISHGADLNATTSHGYHSTPLHYAAWGNKNPEIIERLIHHGAEIDARGSNGSMGINYSTGRETPLISMAMHSHRMDEWEKSEGATPLHLAARYNEEPGIIELLIQHGANLHARNTVLRNTPLHWAAYSNPNSHIVNLLIKLGGSVFERNKDDWTPLHYAACNTSVYVIDKIIREDADLEARTNKGFTPLHFAAYNENEKIIESLISSGAEVDARNDIGETSLHGAAKNKNTAVLDALITKGAEVDAVSSMGKTPLHCAASENSNPNAIQLLIDNGANPNARDGRGATLMHYAAWNECLDVVQAVSGQVELSFEVMRDNFEGTPLHYAAGNECREVVEFIISYMEYEADLTDLSGSTPLHYATKSENAGAIMALLEAHATVELEDNRGNIASKYISWDSRLHGELEMDVMHRLLWDM